MKNNVYRDAVEHLEFSNNLLERVTEVQGSPRPRIRLLRTAAIAALLVALLATTAFGTISMLREVPSNVESLGTAQEDLSDAALMEFSVSDKTEGVTVHYMELEAVDTYSFLHGMLKSQKNGFFRITGDYQLEQIQMQEISRTLEKNDRIYTLNFSYLDTEDGILSDHRSVYYKDENGEILLNATDGNSGQWPVYLNVETGEIRDALPDFTAKDFTGRIAYGYALKNGILISTIVESSEMVDIVENGQVVGRKDASYNLLYWVSQGQVQEITLPDDYKYHVQNNTLYYQDKSGALSCMDDSFTLYSVSKYKTYDDLTNGLLTVRVDGKLGILDALSGDTYIFDEIRVNAMDLDETMGYNAVRYGYQGRIALVQTELIPEEARVALRKLAVLDIESRELMMLEIENGYDGYHNGWLDENRLAVIYRGEGRQYLCIYEFTD